jgi:dTDP-4-amino-4,6-dideoxygalactose transaminase
MTDINAALGLVQLKRLDTMNAKRAANAKFFTRNLSDIDWLETPSVPKNVTPSWHQYTLKILDDKRIKYENLTDLDTLLAVAFIKKIRHTQEKKHPLPLEGIGGRAFSPSPVY